MATQKRKAKSLAHIYDAIGRNGHGEGMHTKPKAKPAQSWGAFIEAVKADQGTITTWPPVWTPGKNAARPCEVHSLNQYGLEEITRHASEKLAAIEVGLRRGRGHVEVWTVGG